MSAKVFALVAVMSAASVLPAEAQVGDRSGRATGTAAQDRERDRDRNDRDRDCERYGHEWDDRPFDRNDRDAWDRSCSDGASGVYGADGRYDARIGDRANGRYDDRYYDRYDARRFNDRFHRNRSYDVRAHAALHERLDRMHAQWHRAHGWSPRDARWRREHEKLHRRLEHMHEQWHRHDRVGRRR